MNQHRTHELRKLFLQIPTFSVTDPRFKTAWRGFKRDYLKVPRPLRLAYMNNLHVQIMELMHAKSMEAQTEVVT